MAQLDDRRARAVGELPAVYAEATRLRMILGELARYATAIGPHPAAVWETSTWPNRDTPPR